MPLKFDLYSRLSQQIQHELRGHPFASEDALRSYLSTARFDGGRLHRYVEGWSADGAGRVADLQGCIERYPQALLICLQRMARMEYAEKRALKSYLRTARAPDEAATLFPVIDAIPETPAFQEAPRFTLPAWLEKGVPT
jgi:hypothetical protein